MAIENLRQAVLEQMGIRPWFPRAPLPGAGSSHHYDLGAGELVFATAKPLPASGEMEPPAAVVANLSQTREADTQEIFSQVITEGNEALEFAFSWFNLDKRLAVLAMLPADAAGMSRSCRQMLQRMLSALSNDYEGISLTEHCFHWPFSDDLGLPSGRLAARQAVDGFVARRLRDQPAAMLLVLADDRPPFLYPQDSEDGDHKALRVHRQFGFAMLRTHSLHAMDGNHELKRSAWVSMKLLLEHLNRTTE